MDKIILTSQANPVELMRELAKHGTNTFALRFLSSSELAERMLMTAGVTSDKQIIAIITSAMIFYNCMKESDLKSKTFDDAYVLATSINKCRMLITNNNELLSLENALKQNLEFKNKNDNLVNIFRKYLEKLNDLNYFDLPSYLHFGIEFGSSIDAEFYILEEFPVSPLEESLIKKASNGNYKKISLLDLFEYKEPIANDLRISSGYGMHNEVKSVIDFIFRNNIPLDKCTIACSDVSSYSKLFMDILGQYNIPVTYGNGFPIKHSNPCILLKLLTDWESSNFEKTALRNLLCSSALNIVKFTNNFPTEVNFDDVVDIACNLRLTNNCLENKKIISDYREKLSHRIDFYFNIPSKDSNDNEMISRLEKIYSLLDSVEILSRNISMDYVNFITNYVQVRNNCLSDYDQMSLNAVLDFIETYFNIVDEGELEEALNECLSLSIGKEISEPGCIHITSIKGALSVARENVFIVGLTSKLFPGNLTEDPNIQDRDFKQFGEGTNIPSSENVFQQKIIDLNNLLKISQNLGSKVYYSFPNYDTSNLKKLNPSSILFEIYRERNPDSTYKDFYNSILPFGYFDNDLEYLSSLDNKLKYEKDKVKFAENLLDRNYSPSAVTDFMECKKRFLFNKLLRVECEEEENIFEVINPKDFGILLHEEARLFLANKWDSNQLFQDASEAFDLYISGNRFSNFNAVNRDKKEFLDQIKALPLMLANFKLLKAEQKLCGYHLISLDNGDELRLNLEGRADLICLDENNDVVIVDFKTGKKIKHKEQDPESCIQGLIYASLYNNDLKCKLNDNLEAKRCIFVYTSKFIAITCENTTATQSVVDLILDDMAKFLVSDPLKYGKPKDSSSCTYCPFKKMCDRKGGADDE